MLNFKNPTVADEVSSLIAGINGVTTISVSSSKIPHTFSVARAIPATATLIQEPHIQKLSRQSKDKRTHNQSSCLQPIIDIGSKLDATNNKLIAIVNWFLDLFPFITRVFDKVSNLISKIIKKLGLACIFPKLSRPFDPFIKHVKCSLGLNKKKIIEAQPCSANLCSNPIMYDKKIPRDRQFPNLYFWVKDTGSRVDECFEKMETETYGARVIVKLVDDQPCDDPRFESLCREIISRGHVIFESDCKSPRYALVLCLKMKCFWLL